MEKHEHSDYAPLWAVFVTLILVLIVTFVMQDRIDNLKDLIEKHHGVEGKTK